MTNTTSHSPRSLIRSTARAPLATKGPVLDAVRFHTVTSSPASIRRAAMTAPIRPVPSQPTLRGLVLIGDSSSSWSDRGVLAGLGGGRRRPGRARPAEGRPDRLNEGLGGQAVLTEQVRGGGRPSAKVSRSPTRRSGRPSPASAIVSATAEPRPPMMVWFSAVTTICAPAAAPRTVAVSSGLIIGTLMTETDDPVPAERPRRGQRGGEHHAAGEQGHVVARGTRPRPGRASARGRRRRSPGSRRA